MTCCLFISYCHEFLNRESYDGFVVPVERELEKNLLFDFLITGRSLENLSYLSSCSLSQRWRFWRIHSNVLRGIESDLAYTNVSGVTFQYTLWSGSLWYPVRSSMRKNKQILLLAISKLMPAFSTVQLDVAKNRIN